MKKNLKMLAAAALTGALTLGLGVTVYAGQWMKDNNGWWFRNSDGSYPASGIYEIDGEKYAFNESGYMELNSWVETEDGGWFYASESGALAQNTWVGNYDVGGDGALQTNTWTPDGYYVGEDGTWEEGKAREEDTLSDTQGLKEKDIESAGSSGLNVDIRDIFMSSYDNALTVFGKTAKSDNYVYYTVAPDTGEYDKYYAVWKERGSKVIGNGETGSGGSDSYGYSDNPFDDKPVYVFESADPSEVADLILY